MPIIGKRKDPDPQLPRVCVGVDPGANGGLAVIMAKEGEAHEILTYKMPKTDVELLKLLRITHYEHTHLFIEKVGGFMGQGKGEAGHSNKAAADRMFNFGCNYGKLLMAITAAGYVEGETYWLVPPQRWQGMTVGTRLKEESKSQYKNRIKAYAETLYPWHKFILATSDAALIAFYGMIYFTHATAVGRGSGATLRPVPKSKRKNKR